MDRRESVSCVCTYARPMLQMSGPLMGHKYWSRKVPCSGCRQHSNSSANANLHGQWPSMELRMPSYIALRRGRSASMCFAAIGWSSSPRRWMARTASMKSRRRSASLRQNFPGDGLSGSSRRMWSANDVSSGAFTIRQAGLQTDSYLAFPCDILFGTRKASCKDFPQKWFCLACTDALPDRKSVV